MQWMRVKTRAQKLNEINVRELQCCFVIKHCIKEFIALHCKGQNTYIVE